MSYNPEWGANGLPIHDPANGGSAFGYTWRGDGLVDCTKYGEFACALSDEGDLVASFPEQGMVMIYSQEGHLILASVDIGGYLSGFDDADFLKMPNQGEDILGLITFLAAERLQMFMAVSLRDKNFKVIIANEEGEMKILSNLEGVDFSKNLVGEAGIRDQVVAFQVSTNHGEDLAIAFGERKGSSLNMIGVEISTYVDYEDNLFGDDLRRLRKLAKKIIPPKAKHRY